MPLENEYAKAKAKFYANPVFASLCGLVVGFVAGAVIF
jgi:hypothetical protein